MSGSWSAANTLCASGALFKVKRKMMIVPASGVIIRIKQNNAGETCHMVVGMRAMQ